MKRAIVRWWLRLRDDWSLYSAIRIRPDGSTYILPRKRYGTRDNDERS